MFGILTVYLVAIVFLFYAYVYVWSRGPQDGRLWRMIRRLRKAERYWRKRALRDEAILSRVIDKKTLALVAFLCLFLIPAVNPDMSSIPAAIGNEYQEAMFSTAADGDESSDGVTSLSETLDDDVLFYPDSENTLDQNVNVTNEYYYTSCDEVGSWGAWFGDPWNGGRTTSGGNIIFNHTSVVGDTVGTDENSQMSFVAAKDREFKIFLNFSYSTNGSITQLRFGTGDTGSDYIDLDSYSADTFHQVNFFRSEYFTVDTIIFRVDIPIGVSLQLTVDYIAIVRYTEYSEASGYAESFQSVSDWTQQTGEDWGTDGDRMYVDVAKDAAYDAYYTNSPSITNGKSYYYEVRLQNNITDLYKMNVVIRWYSQDTMGGTYGQTGNLATTSTDQTFKGIISSDQAIECLYVLFYVASSASGPNRFYFDYLRIGNSTSMGWQHDGSTTAGVTDGGGGSSSSDGDELTLTADADGSTFEFAIDTTATAAYLDADYYPMIGLDFNDADSADYVKVESYDGAAWATVIANTTVGTDTLYANCRAADADIEKFRIFVNPSANPRLKWFKAFSIANYTCTMSGVGVDDYLYVDSGILYSHIDDGYIELDHDPALSVSDTYSVYNLTTSGTAPQFSQYVSSWSSYSDDTRGATTSGTVTDIKLKFDSTETLSAIKFIEDGTAPSVLRISATPPEPDDTESVTLSALATDTVEVYKVWFRPITGPTGYSQTDYESTEQTDNLWTYEFSSLDEGYWAFKAIAFDGANNSTLDADSVTDFWVREKELIISNTLYTETSTQCSFAGQTNVACDYLIYDDDAEQESGNKAAGSFFLDWTKQTSVGTHDWGIKFYTASSTDWHNGSYEVLTTTLLVTEYGIRTTDNYAYLHGYVTLDSNYTVYEETVQVGTGSVNAGSFEFRWTKASSSVENVTVLFESGSQSYPVYSGYDVAEQATFVVESWWMDLNLGVESYVEFYVLSSFENATVYVYDNDTLMTTVTEAAGGAYSYFWMAESQGLHIITLNITHGGTVHTRTRTYFIPDWAVTGLVLRWDLWTFQDNYTMMELESNWNNCTYYVYLNGSLVATSANDPVILNFTRSINIGEYNLTIHAYGGTQNYTIKNIRYIITEEGVSYDYSQVTGGRSVRYGDNYNYYTVTTEEPAPGVFIDQGTATIVSVGGFLIFFLAFLAAREIKKSEILKTERVLSR